VQKELDRDHWSYLRRPAPQMNWMAQVSFQELQALGFRGSYEVVKLWLRPLRQKQQHRETATLRFETGPGKHSQVDWGRLALVIGEGGRRQAHLFALKPGSSRSTSARAF
jgi:transposase